MTVMVMMRLFWKHSLMPVVRMMFMYDRMTLAAGDQPLVDRPRYSKRYRQ